MNEEALRLAVNDAGKELREAFDAMMLHCCSTWRNRKMMEFKVKLAEFERLERTYSIASAAKYGRVPYEDG